MMTEKSKSRAVEHFDRAVRFMAIAGGLVLIFMVCVTVVDVFLRKFFNAPMFGTQDVSMMALILVVFFGMAYCARVGGHVAVDLINGANPKLLRITDIFINLLGTFVVGALAVRAGVETYRDFIGVRATNLLPIPYWPFEAAISFCSGLFALVLLYNAYLAIMGKPADKADH